MFIFHIQKETHENNEEIADDDVKGVIISRIIVLWRVINTFFGVCFFEIVVRHAPIIAKNLFCDVLMTC